MLTRSRIEHLRSEVLRFVRERSTGRIGEYRYSISGAPILYSSCYALMTLHYLCAAPSDPKMRSSWAQYFLDWQDATTGYFVGPELRGEQALGPVHDPEHLRLHLTTTILPCLDLLGAVPRYPLQFAELFLSEQSLRAWLGRRDWRDAWLEGNNLLFALQVLIYCRDKAGHPQAQARLNQFFDWLEENVDPATGLWGTNGHCSPFMAMCGGYHQLLAYYHEKRPVLFPERLIDTTLALQHADGGFHPSGGGGACEDVDAVDILVNLYKRINYRRPAIRIALRKALRSVMEKQMLDGGFVYRLNESFSHMGMPQTLTPPNQSTMFSTWFRVHTLALIAQVLRDSALAGAAWKFNTCLSMGWHEARGTTVMEVSRFALLEEMRDVGLVTTLRARLSRQQEDFVRLCRDRVRDLFGGGRR